MAAIFKQVTIPWKGENHPVTANMAVINRIENNVSLAVLGNRMQEGNIPISHYSAVLGELLRHGGVKVTNEDVYHEMFHGDADPLWEVAGQVMQAVFPSPKKSDK